MLVFGGINYFSLVVAAAFCWCAFVPTPHGFIACDACRTGDFQAACQSDRD